MPTTNHITYMHGWTGLLSLPFLYILISMHTITTKITPSFTQIFLLTIACAVGAIGDVVYSKTQKISSLTLNGLFVPFGTLFSCLFGWMLLVQIINAYQLIGVIIIMLSVGIANYFSSTEPMSIIESQGFPDLKYCVA